MDAKERDSLHQNINLQQNNRKKCVFSTTEFINRNRYFTSVGKNILDLKSDLRYSYFVGFALTIWIKNSVNSVATHEQIQNQNKSQIQQFLEFSSN